MAAEKTLLVTVVSPEKELWSGEATHVVVPAHDGEMGIYPGHAAIVARLGSGVMRIKHAATTEKFFVSGGFVQAGARAVTVLSDAALTLEALDRVDAAQRLEKALAQQSRGDEELDQKAAVVTEARARVRAASR